MQIFAKTDIGKERKINEDFFYISDMKDEIQLAILADGMGGYNAGEVASKTATQAVKEYIQKHFSKDDIEETIRQAIEYANRVVYDKAKKQKELDGMGTTLDVCLIYNNKVYIGHIGDREVNDSVSAKEGKRTDRAIILHTIYINISPGRAYDSKCLIHIILPPLRVSLQAQCAHCLRHRQLHLYRCGYRQLQVHAEQRHLLLPQHPASVHCR